jgi:hypothetical protein
LTRLDQAIQRDAKKIDPRVKAADDGPRRWIDFIGKRTRSPRLHEIDRNRISRSETASSANLERLKIRHDPAAVLLYGNGRVG